jgi:dynein heavy chain
MIKPKKCSDVETLTKLWVHESMRIFYDRLINEEDQSWFKGLIAGLCTQQLKSHLTTETLFVTPIVFADFMNPKLEPKDRLYEEVKDLNKMTGILNNLLEDYNVEFPTQMNLVFFMDALTHTARISRILRQPRGNTMLIGVGGSGKQSLTTMAAYVAGMTLESIKITRGYGIAEFREDIKKYMLKAGVEDKDVVFLFTDSQIGTNSSMISSTT